MKRLLSAFIAVSLAFCTLSFSSSSSSLSTVKNPVPFKKFHVQGSTTLSGGCVITYNLILDVNLIPPRFNSLTGSISMSGNCSGTQNINVNQLRGNIDSGTKETTDFHIDEQLFENTSHQAEFEVHLQNQINDNRDDVFTDTDN